MLLTSIQACLVSAVILLATAGCQSEPATTAPDTHALRSVGQQNLGVSDAQLSRTSREPAWWATQPQVVERDQPTRRSAVAATNPTDEVTLEVVQPAIKKMAVPLGQPQPKQARRKATAANRAQTVDADTAKAGPFAIFGPAAKPDYPVTLESPHAETFQVNASPKRLAEDLYRSFLELGWGRARYSAWHPHDREPEQPVVWAQAILAHGETAYILAWAEPGQTEVLNVALRIGPLGTPKEQQRLRGTLDEFLKGPRMRQYQGTWELPAYPGTRRWEIERSQQR